LTTSHKAVGEAAQKAIVEGHQSKLASKDMEHSLKITELEATMATL